MRRARQNFFTGIAVLLPIILTYFVFQYLWGIADSILVDPVYSLLENFFPVETNRTVTIFLIKTVILMVTVGMICVLGLTAELILVKQLIRFGESVVLKVPMVNKVYSVLKEISATFFGKHQKDMFRQAVLLEYPRKGLWSVAFITKTDHLIIREASGQNLVSVFVPTTPNPTSGVLIFVQREELIDLPYTIEDAIKLVISAGTLSSREELLKYKKDSPHASS